MEETVPVPLYLPRRRSAERTPSKGLFGREVLAHLLTAFCPLILQVIGTTVDTVRMNMSTDYQRYERTPNKSSSGLCLIACRLPSVPEDESAIEPSTLKWPDIEKNRSSWRHMTDLSSSSRLGRYSALLKNVALYALAIWGLWTIVSRPFLTPGLRANNAEAQSLGCSCGDSVDEALSLGCKFDALAMAWLPEHCRDDELTAEFDTTGKGPGGSWVYYADTAHTIEVDVSEVAAMGDDPSKRVHMDNDWHQIHCIYYWLKLHRSRSNGKIVEPRSDTEGHIRHCGMVFQGPPFGTISGVALDTNEAAREE